MNVFLKEKLKERKEMIEIDKHEIVSVVYDVIKESFTSLKYSIKKNIGKIGGFLNVIIPYICVLCERNGIFYNWILVLIIPLMLLYVSYLMKQVNMAINNRTIDNVPVPSKRFTVEDTDGAVTVEETRVEELLLYVNELENELERIGKL